MVRKALREAVAGLSTSSANGYYPTIGGWYAALCNVIRPYRQDIGGALDFFETVSNEFRREETRTYTLRFVNDAGDEFYVYLSVYRTPTLGRFEITAYIT